MKTITLEQAQDVLSNKTITIAEYFKDAPLMLKSRVFQKALRLTGKGIYQVISENGNIVKETPTLSEAILKYNSL